MKTISGAEVGGTTSDSVFLRRGLHSKAMVFLKFVVASIELGMNNARIMQMIASS